MNIINIDIPDIGLVLVAGRPATGKTFTLLNIADDFVKKGKKPVVVYADRRTAHSSYLYKNGETIKIPSELVKIKEKFPDVPYIIDDQIARGSCETLRQFVDDLIEHEKPNAILMNSIGFPGKKVDTETIKTLQETAKARNILIICEIGMARAIERSKNQKPQAKYIRCDKEALAFVDEVILTCSLGLCLPKEKYWHKTEVCYENRKGT